MELGGQQGLKAGGAGVGGVEEVVDLLTGWSHLGHWNPEDKGRRRFSWACWEVGVSEAAPDRLCDPEPALPKLHSPGSRESETGVSAKKRSDPSSADVIQDEVFPLPVRPLLKRSIAYGLSSS